MFECLSFTAAPWTFMDRVVPSNAITGVNILIIENVTADNAGRYECQGSNELQQNFLAVATLIVEG